MTDQPRLPGTEYAKIKFAGMSAETPETPTLGDEVIFKVTLMTLTLATSSARSCLSARLDPLQARPRMSRLCSRPNLHGGSCQKPLLWYEDACHWHATQADNDQALARLRESLAQRLAHETCPCSCHATIQPGLITCPRCA